MRRASFLLVFAASGAAALIYEVTWTRLLTLQFGHGVAAASTVLAAFMGGLAAGAAIGGRVGNRLDRRRALIAYAALEAAIAVLALLLPMGLAALQPVFLTAYADGGGSMFGLLRLAASLVLLSVPAAAMGATFPVASRWMVRGRSRAASDAGFLYAANTIGAAGGALLAGFVLLSALGLSGTTWVGTALNVVAAAGALAIGRREPAAAAAAAAAATTTVAVDASRTRSRPRGGRTPSPRGPATRRGLKTPRYVHQYPNSRTAGEPAVTHGQLRWAALALAVSGFASLALQVVWTRLAALILGPTTYAFSIVVAIFIAGIALGSALGARLAARAREPVGWLAVCLGLSVAFAVAAAGFVDGGLLLNAGVIARPDVGFGDVLMHQIGVVAGLLLPMTVVFGAAFPFAVAAATRHDETVVADLGFIYAANTVGAIAGSLLAGFVLIPWSGLDDTIRLVALVAITAAAAIGLGALQRRQRLRTVTISLGALAYVWWAPSWNPLLLSSGAYKYAAQVRGPDLQTGLTAGRLRYYREGSHATVTVRELAGTLSLAIDGKVDASNAGDMLTQRLLAHLPLLLHPDPTRVAVVGLGSGVTLGSALRHPIEQATVLEISPEVVEASRFFDAYNHKALDDRRTTLIVGDGRTHMLLTTARYDVIVSEPSNPWMAGLASLFTREFFEAARARLAPGGVLCQWAHTYDISAADLKSIVATFLSVFPDGTLWLVGDSDVLLVGSTEPLGRRLHDVADNWERSGVAEDLAEVGVLEPFSLLSLFMAEGPALSEWVADAALQTDDRAALEFSGPRTLFARNTRDNAVELRALANAAARPKAVQRAFATASAEAWRNRGWMHIRADSYRPATEDFGRALALDPDDTRALDGLVQAASRLDLEPRAEAILRKLATGPARIAATLALAKLLAARGAYEDAGRLPLSVLRVDPENVAALEQLASILADLGDAERLAPVVTKLQSAAPGTDAARYYTATLLLLQGRPDLAAEEARRLVARNPDHAKGQNLLGASLATLGHRDEARDAFRASLDADPRDPATYTNLGTLALEAGDRPAAVRLFAEALIVDPASEAAGQGLAAAMGRH